jgi:hypothetical protein
LANKALKGSGGLKQLDARRVVSGQPRKSSLSTAGIASIHMKQSKKTVAAPQLGQLAPRALT